MTVPEWVKPGAWGAAIGIVVIGIIAFSAGWVMWTGSANEMADTRAEKAVLVALTPICVAQFKNATKAAAVTTAGAAPVASRTAQLAALQKEDSWKRGDYVENKGWATMPGSAEPNDEVAEACAQELMKLAEKREKK